MTFGTLVSRSATRALARSDVEAFCTEQGISVVSWLVAHAHTVASRFLLGALSWDESSAALNSTWPAIVTDDELTPFFFDVYRAFEDAETLESESARATFTRDRLQQMRLLPNE